MTADEARQATDRIRLALDRVSNAWADLGERITDAYRRRADQSTIPALAEKPLNIEVPALSVSPELAAEWLARNPSWGSPKCGTARPGCRRGGQCGSAAACQPARMVP